MTSINVPCSAIIPSILVQIKANTLAVSATRASVCARLVPPNVTHRMFRMKDHVGEARVGEGKGGAKRTGVGKSGGACEGVEEDWP